MPRVNPLRTLANEENLAQRIAYEREQRGWSYDGTASRMVAAGYPIQPSAIFKIEKGKPRRRVTVDELVGFASVFENSVEEMLVPVEVVYDREARALLTGMAQAQEDLIRAVDASIAMMAAVRAFPASRPSAAKLWQIMEEPGAHTPYVAERSASDSATVTSAQAAMQDAFEALIAAMLQIAEERLTGGDDGEH